MFKIHHWTIFAANCLRRKRECNFTPKEVSDVTYTNILQCIYLPIFLSSRMGSTCDFGTSGNFYSVKI